MSYILHLTIFICIYIILSLSLNLVVGYLGRLNLAHAAFAAIGGYSYALASASLNLSFFPSLILAIIITMLISLALSLPSWRLSGDFYVIITLSVGTVVHGIINSWYAYGEEIGGFKNLTNGPFGISGIPKPDIYGINLDTIDTICLLSVLMTIICIIFISILTKSPWGRLLESLRDDELSLKSLGKNIKLLKIQVFAFSCGLASISGVLYASYVSYIDPTMASTDESILLLCMLYIGGSGNLLGPIIGSIILVILPELLRFTPIPDNIANEVRLMAYGLLLVVLVHLRPKGLFGKYEID